MKKKIWLSILVVIFLTGCTTGIENTPKKTTYNVNEEAFIDHFQITCTNFEVENQNTENSRKKLKVNYTVTNNSNQKTEINLQKDFQLYTESKDLTNSISEGTISLNASETKEIEVLFQLEDDNQEPKPTYTIIFYSNVATNNIGFVLE